MNKPPKVKIEGCKLKESYCIRYGKKWKAKDLIKHSKKYEVFDLPLAGIDLTTNAWVIKDIDDFIYQVGRVKNTSLKYPIIIDYAGCVCDGWHRIAKAILQGCTTIKAIRLETMPDKYEIVEDES